MASYASVLGKGKQAQRSRFWQDSHPKNVRCSCETAFPNFFPSPHTGESPRLWQFGRTKGPRSSSPWSRNSGPEGLHHGDAHRLVRMHGVFSPAEQLRSVIMGGQIWGMPTDLMGTCVLSQAWCYKQWLQTLQAACLKRTKTSLSFLSLSHAFLERPHLTCA